MEELLIKISEILDMSVEGLQVAYPVLRDQYIWYRVFNSIDTLSLVVFTISLGVSVVLMICFDSNCFYNEDEIKAYRKRVNIFIGIAIISALTMLGASIIQTILSTDLLILKELL